MKNRFILVGLVAMMSVLASAKTFIDKTNLDQLNYRVLDSGQFAWTEEDGSAVLYVGSPTEVKNIRVTDPTALRGYRYKTINDELSFNADDVFVSTVTSNSTMFTFTYNSTQHESLKQLKYTDLEQKGNGHVVEDGAIKINDWYGGIFIKNNDGTYTATVPPDGTVIGGTNQTNKAINYAYGYKCITLTVDVIAHDTAIEELDFLYEQSRGSGIGDMDPIHTSRRIIYDGRHAKIEVDLTYTSGNGKFIKLSNFSAKCRGIGDVEFVNDLTQNKILIYDYLFEKEDGGSKRRIDPATGKFIKDDDGELPGFDLSQMRYWAKHLYDGNRGVDWSKYPALDHVNMSNRWFRYVGNYCHGPNGNGYTFAKDGNEFFSYENGESSGDGPYAGVQIAFTAINNAARLSGGTPLSLDIIIDVPAGKQRPPLDLFRVQWKDDLRDSLWLPIHCVWTQTDAEGLEWHIEVPEAYSGPMNKAGFYRIYLNSEPYNNKVKIVAELQVVGSDGYMYKLTWPSGGGAVTATLVD